jgi:hypothetical protein
MEGIEVFYCVFFGLIGIGLGVGLYFSIKFFREIKEVEEEEEFIKGSETESESEAEAESIKESIKEVESEAEAESIKEQQTEEENITSFLTLTQEEI